MQENLLKDYEYYINVNGYDKIKLILNDAISSYGTLNVYTDANKIM